MKLQWTVVIILAIYNLQLRGTGKYGFFRWRPDICGFIDQNWNVFFGDDRKKAATWHHTVASVLSSNCNKYFLSGADQLGEKGWWTLKYPNLPTVEELERMQVYNKAHKKGKLPLTVDPGPVLERTRHGNAKNIVEAALALKAKRTMIEDAETSQRSIKKKRKPEESIELKITLSKDCANVNSASDSLEFTQPHILKDEGIENVAENIEIGDPELEFNIMNVKSEPVDETSLLSESDCSSSQRQAEIESVKQWLKRESSDNEDNIEIEVDDDAVSHHSLGSESLDKLLDDILNESENESVRESIKSDEYSEDQESNSVSSPALKNPVTDAGRKRKVTVKEEPLEDQSEADSAKTPKYMPMNVYEEQQLLSKLREFMPAVQKNIRARNLYRKLVIRKIKKERNLPIFDLDKIAKIAFGIEPLRSSYNSSSNPVGRQEILDRYQTVHGSTQKVSLNRGSFFSRLMGLDDEQQENVISPYTTRILKPFIYRDYETEPLKLKLLREILTYSHRNDPNWKLPPACPIDYCYVRPQHIPAVNSLCQEFFWPGIDLSECLQYPDFSCIALYRKVIIGFAFMVPDVNINEAYITFIFTHPDWRRAGLATFMLYHLIQTCMGKDITLHVSANSPATLLYQKFGFKVEEFILDFYDKYLPADSKECRHALFLRLSR